MQTLVKNVATVAAMFDAFAKGDIPFILEQFHEKGNWHVSGAPDIPYARKYHGRSDLVIFFTELDKTFAFTVFKPEHIVEASENLVIATGYAEGYARKTNKQIQSKWAMTLEFDEEGMLIDFVDIFDTVQLANALK